MDNSNTIVSSSSFVDRSQPNKVKLDLRYYIDDPLVYFEDTSAGMGYVSTSTNSVFYVEISNNVFYIDSSANPQLTFTSGETYVFDLSHNSNAGNTFVLGTIPDSSVNLIDYQTIVGTPGQPGAYTTFTASGETVFYYSFETPAMGYEPPTYKVKMDTNVLGDTVFSIQKPGETEYYIQPDLSFGAGFVGLFDVADIGSYSLVFGTEVDVSSTIQRQYYSQTGDIIVLSIQSDYSDDPLVYFEDTSAGMGYAPASSFHQTPTTDVPVSRQPLGNPSKEFIVLKYNNKDGFNTTFALENTQLILDFINDNYDGNTLTIGTETTSTFKESQRLYYMYYDTIYYMFLTWFDAPWIDPDPPGDNYYSVISENNTDLEDNYPEAWGPRDYWLSDYGTGSGRSGGGPGIRHANGTNVGNEQPYNRVDYANIGIPTSGNITVYYGDPLIPLSNVEYTITVVSGVFHIDGSPTPTLSLINGVNYVFDQSDDSNENNTLVIGTAPDISSSIVSSGLTIMGTPGQSGAYTHYVSNGSPVYYFSFETPDMGYEPQPYIVKTETNVLGDTVFSIQKPGETVYYAQPDLSFGAGFAGQFDVSQLGESYSLVFGTEVDVSSTIQTQYFSQFGDIIFLSIPSDYSGNSLKYFEDTSAGMGYMPPSGTGSYIYQLVQSDFRNTSVLGDWGPSNTDTYVYNYTLDGNTDYTFANGTYDISQSDYDTRADFHKYLHRVVSSNISDGHHGYDWHTSASYNSSTGYADGSITTTTNTSTTYTGSWIQMKLPYGLNIKKVSIDKRDSYFTANPKDAHLLGSNDDGATFYHIADISLNDRGVTTSGHYDTIYSSLQFNKNGSK